MVEKLTFIALEMRARKRPRRRVTRIVWPLLGVSVSRKKAANKDAGPGSAMARILLPRLSKVSIVCGGVVFAAGVLNENPADLFHYLDLCSPLRSCHLPDPFVRKCIHAEPFSCVDRATNRFCDLGDHTGTALDSSLI